jgi:hypothetical protein
MLIFLDFMVGLVQMVEVCITAALVEAGWNKLLNKLVLPVIMTQKTLISFIALLNPTGHVMHQQFNLLNPTGHVMHQQFNLLKPTGHVMHQQFNLLKPTGQVMHQQFNIQKLYVLPTLYLCVLYLSENKQRLVPLTA